MVNICENCAHRNVCRYREPCEECNQFLQEVVRCKDCKHRGSETYCPMRFEEWYEIDEGDGYYDSDITTHDRTIDEGFCDRGERKENEETNEERNAVG